MGACCETARNNGREPQNLLSTAPTSNSIRTREGQRRANKFERSFLITENSFRQIPKDTLSLIYKRESESLECKSLYSTIYQATHIASSTPALVREIKKRIVKKKLTSEKFFESIGIQKELDHPNVAKVFELFEDEDYYYLIYENIRGNFLSDYINKNRHLSESETTVIGRRMASIIQFLHTKDIVNGLICPENLIFGLNGRIETIKLLDFSFAARLRKDEPKSCNPLPIKYRAPEVLKGKGYSRSSEIWAFGALLHTMLHGEGPLILSEGEIEFNNDKINTQFRFKSSRDISPQMKALIQDCVAIDPKKRPKICELLRHGALNKPRLERRKSTQEVSQALKIPQDKGKIHQLIVEFILNRVMDPSEKLSCIRFFELVDTNSNGSISRLELLEFSKLRNDPIRAQKEIDQLFRSINSDPSHQITYTEFLSLIMNRRFILTRQNIETAFKLLDVSQNGYLIKEDLFTQLEVSNASDEDWNMLFQKNASRKCYQINFQQFMNSLCRDP